MSRLASRRGTGRDPAGASWDRCSALRLSRDRGGAVDGRSLARGRVGFVRAYATRLSRIWSAVFWQTWWNRVPS